MGTKLIWVDEEFGNQYEKITSDEERYKVFEEYLATVRQKSRDDFRANLDSLEEDVAIYTGLMLKVKQSFEKAKNEQLSASYELWEKFENELPSTTEKVQSLVNVLNPLIEKLNMVQEKLRGIDAYDVQRINEILIAFNNLSENNRKIFDFIVEHYQK